MASTSGQINTAWWTNGGSNTAYGYVKWDNLRQDVANNRSTISAHLGFYVNSGGWYWSNNAIRINWAYCNGAQIHGSYTWSNLSGTGNHDYWVYDIVIPHNADGTKTFAMSGSFWLYNGPDRGTGDGWWELPAIPRKANYTNSSPFCETPTRNSLNIAVCVDATCDSLAWKFNGGAWNYVNADFSGWKVITVPNLNPGVQYSFVTSVKNKASQLWNESGVFNGTTSPHANDWWQVLSVNRSVIISRARAFDTFDAIRWAFDAEGWATDYGDVGGGVFYDKSPKVGIGFG